MRIGRGWGLSSIGAAVALLAACGAMTGTSSDRTRPPDTASSAESGARPASAGPSPADPRTMALPSGDRGIAARHPGDRGIAADPAVVFADDFESYTSESGLSTRWTAVHHNAHVTTEPHLVFAGRRSLEFVSPRQTAELSNAVSWTLPAESDVLFLRYHSRFEPTFDVIGSSHNGASLSARYVVDGKATPGVPADGTNKFLIAYECWRGTAADPNPGYLNVYVYHPEQRSQWGDHFFPDGRVLPNSRVPGNFGPDFVARPNRVPTLGRWHSYEVMLAANTPGVRDGRIALWLDGELIADFRTLRLRDVATLRIDRIALSLHTRSNPIRETRKWYDNVVAARAYIGPTFGR
jgi:hypothetical protein